MNSFTFSYPDVPAGTPDYPGRIGITSDFTAKAVAAGIDLAQPFVIAYADENPPGTIPCCADPQIETGDGKHHGWCMRGISSQGGGCPDAVGGRSWMACNCGPQVGAVAGVVYQF